MKSKPSLEIERLVDRTVLRQERLRPGTYHKEMILTLLRTRDMEKYYREIPKLGFVTFKILLDHHQVVKRVAVAMGCLRKIEGRMALLDSYITDPSASPDDRNNALNSITKSLLDYAQKHQITHLFAFSIYPEIYERAKRHGFKQNSYTLAVMDVRGKL